MCGHMGVIRCTATATCAESGIWYLVSGTIPTRVIPSLSIRSIITVLVYEPSSTGTGTEL